MCFRQRGVFCSHMAAVTVGGGPVRSASLLHDLRKAVCLLPLVSSQRGSQAGPQKGKTGLNSPLGDKERQRPEASSDRAKWSIDRTLTSWPVITERSYRVYWRLQRLSFPGVVISVDSGGSHCLFQSVKDIDIDQGQVCRKPLS